MSKEQNEGVFGVVNIPGASNHAVVALDHRSGTMYVGEIKTSDDATSHAVNQEFFGMSVSIEGRLWYLKMLSAVVPPTKRSRPKDSNNGQLMINGAAFPILEKETVDGVWCYKLGRTKTKKPGKQISIAIPKNEGLFIGEHRIKVRF